MINIITVYGQLLFKALGQTLLLALLGLFFACILGIIFGIMSVLKSKVCRIIQQIFVDIIRGVPMIVLAFFIYFGVPYAFNNLLGVRMVLTALQAGTIALALNCGAYMSEIIRAGIQSVDVGQMEAARSLGLSYWKAMYRVIMPQAIRTMIPTIINQFIPELVNTAKTVVANTMDSFSVWAIVGVMYLIVITILSKVAKALERRLSYDRKK